MPAHAGIHANTAAAVGRDRSLAVGGVGRNRGPWMAGPEPRRYATMRATGGIGSSASTLLRPWSLAR